MNTPLLNKRKQDTREKIKIGGLFTKFKIDYLDERTIAGAVEYLKILLESEQKDFYLNKFYNRGKEIFEEDIRRKAEKQNDKNQTINK